MSSNKKKRQLQQEQQKQNDPEHHEQLQRLEEKRESISRNLTKQFEISEAEDKNPLLRSESSKETEQRNSKEEQHELSMDALQDCHDNVNHDTEQQQYELTMEALQVSSDIDNPTQLEDDLELISQKIVSLVVDSKPISLSSGSTDNLNDELALSESQSSSTNAENQVLVVRHIPINVKEALNQENISLNLTNSTQADDMDKTYQMTEDEHEDEDNEEENSTEEEEVITISDTSGSHNEPESDVMTTSSIPSSSLLLPSLTDNKAERVAAFLRDVSIERRNMLEQGQLHVNDTVDQLLDNADIDQIQETLIKSKQIAAADTESMTADGDEDEITPKPIMDREKRLKALESLVTEDENGSLRANTNINRTIENAYERGLEETPRNCKAFDKTESNLNFSISDLVETPKISDKFRFVATPNRKNNSRCLADIETEENTVENINESLQLAYKDPLITPVNQNENEEIVTTPQNKNNSRCLADIETEENTLQSTNKSVKQANENISNTLNQVDEECKTPDRNNPHRLANDDTLANSTVVDIAKAISQIYDYTPIIPKNSYKIRQNSPISSLRSTPHSSKDVSIIDSSTERNVTAPEESIVISETDNESIDQNEAIDSDDNKKLSSSFHKNKDSSISENSDNDCDGDGQMSQLKMSMGSISISAKINIKIHVQSSTSTDGDPSDDNDDETKLKTIKDKSLIEENSSKEQEELAQELTEESEGFNHSSASTNSSADNISPETCNQMQRKTVDENVLVCSNKSCESPEVIVDEKFLTEAEKLLTQLYGKSWQTPDVMRTLKRTSQSGEKKSNNSNNSSQKVVKNVKTLKAQKSVKNSVVEESILDDFSICKLDDFFCFL